MDRKDTQIMIEVMQAFADGKTIQYNARGEDDWADNNSPSWSWDDFEYRVKTEPLLRYRRALCRVLGRADDNQTYYIGVWYPESIHATHNNPSIVRWFDEDWVTVEA